MMKNIKEIIEWKIAKHFNIRHNLIVPNVWWGLDFAHECDLVILTPADYAYEVEIKISKQDIKNDLEKSHGHYSEYLKRLYFAIPEELEGCIDLIPERAGVLSLRRRRDNHRHIEGKITELRKPKVNIYARKFSEMKRRKLYHLAAMRIWGLKEKLLKEINGG